MVSLILVIIAPGCSTVPDGVSSGRPKTTRVLFIGNSYTYYNDIPMQMVRMAEDEGLGEVETGIISAGGAKLREHAENPKTMPRMQEGWDVVVIQGHSLEALTDSQGFLNAAQSLAASARATGARVYFYETWARAPGHAVYEEPWSQGSPRAMQQAINAAYSTAAERSGGTLVPVGTSRAEFAERHPRVPLYTDDGSHPTPQASYFAACVLFIHIFNAEPGSRHIPWGVTEDEAELIRSAITGRE